MNTHYGHTTGTPLPYQRYHGKNIVLIHWATPDAIKHNRTQGLSLCAVSTFILNYIASQVDNDLSLCVLLRTISRNM